MERIRTRIGARSSGTRFRSPHLQWVLAAAAAALLVAGSWEVLRVFRPKPGSVLEEQAAAVLRIGANDHIQCAVNHQMSARRFTFEDMSGSMGPQYVGLVSAVKERMPIGYEIVVGHKCHVNHREFVHLILKNGDTVVSLAVTRKGPDSFAGKNLVAAPNSSGIPLYNGRVDDYHVAGFETRDYLAFLVSTLNEGENLQMASHLAPPVREFLTRSEI